MITWCISVSETLNKETEESVKKLGYASKSEFVREAVREAVRRGKNNE